MRPQLLSSVKLIFFILNSNRMAKYNLNRNRSLKRKLIRSEIAFECTVSMFIGIDCVGKKNFTSAWSLNYENNDIVNCQCTLYSSWHKLYPIEVQRQFVGRRDNFLLVIARSILKDVGPTIYVNCLQGLQSCSYLPSCSFWYLAFTSITLSPPIP